MRKEVTFIILLAVFLGSFLGRIISRFELEEPHVLEDLCLPKESSPSGSLKPAMVIKPPEGWLVHQNPEYGFAFQMPKERWYSHQDMIQEFEEQLAFPKIDYSLYFSHPVENANSLHWGKGQEASLRFLVFKSNCQDLDEWLRLISGGSEAAEKEINVDGRKGIRLKGLRGYQDNEVVIFNNDPYLYQFQLQTRGEETLPVYSELLTEIVSTFKFF